MPSRDQTSTINLWERWLGRVTIGRVDTDVRERAKIEAFRLLNQAWTNTKPSTEIAETLVQATGAEGMVFYERVNEGAVKKRLATISQIKIHATSFSRRQLEECIVHPSLLLTLGPITNETLSKLKKPISLQRLDQPLNFYFRFSLGENRLIVLFFTDPPFPNDQLFLAAFTAAVKNSQMTRNLATALQAETERLATVTQQLSEGLVILDENLRIKLWNRPLQRLTGFSPLEVENKLYAQALQRTTQPKWLDQIVSQANKTTERNVFYEQLEILTKQNNRKWVTISGSFLRDDSGEVMQTILLVSDFSRHKELEDRKNEFISIATHELRTPITAIKGYLSLIRRGQNPMNPKDKLYLGRATEATDRLVRLTEDLLQVVRVEENRVPYALRPVVLATTIEQIITDFQDKADRKGLKIRYQKPTFPTTIIADQERIEQIFANLIDNAIKYTPKGRVTIQFEEATHPLTHERQIVSVIADTGIGLSLRERETVFEKFHRTIRARATREGGTGLGLFIVKSFVEKQHGTIKVKSGLTRGSEFRIIFPAMEAKPLERKTTHEKNRVTNRG